MQLGFYMGYAPPGTNPRELIELAQEAERLGYGSAWAAEAWGTDAVTVLSWLAATTSTIEIGSAIMQMPARTAANAAMTAATLDLMSGGRFILGLGTSGPQVVEGWHGQPWGKPLTRTREYVATVRRALRRDPSVPYAGEDATGLGKPLKLMMRPLRKEIPIYLAALSPKNVSLAFEIADGWLPIFFSPERARDAFGYEPREGFEIAPVRPGNRHGRPGIGAGISCGRSLRCTSAAWARRRPTSTTGSCAGTATRPRRSGSRSCTWRASSWRQSRPSPMR